MKKLYYTIVTLLGIVITLYAFTCGKAEPSFPRPQGAVNDFASVIASNEEQRIDTICREVLQKTGTAIVIVTVDTVGDSDYATYANELYADWGIGKKGEDKGVLIFLAKKERKNFDMIVLNSLKDKGAGFGTDTNRITIISRNNKEQKFELKSKRKVATDIIDAIFDII